HPTVRSTCSGQIKDLTASELWRSAHTDGGAMNVSRSFAVVLALCFVSALVIAAPKHRSSRTVNLAILAINDLHGNLESPGTGASIPGATEADKAAAVGGAANMAT